MTTISYLSWDDGLLSDGEPFEFYILVNYKSNGKELNDELNLNGYDYGARNYDAAIGRFNRIDRFAEKYYTISPYSYAGNNPVLYNDMAGDSIGIGKELFNKFRAGVIEKRDGILKNRQTRINELRANGNGEKADRLTADWAANDAKKGSDMSIINQTLSELNDIESSTQRFDLYENDKNVSENASGSTSYDIGNDAVKISVRKGFTMGVFGHELKHAYQFLSGALSFNSNGNAGYIYDYTDEKEAHDRGGFFGGQYRSDTEISELYPRLPFGNRTLNGIPGPSNQTYRDAFKNQTHNNSIKGTAQQQYYINWKMTEKKIKFKTTIGLYLFLILFSACKTYSPSSVDGVYIFKNDIGIRKLILKNGEFQFDENTVINHLISGGTFYIERRKIYLKSNDKYKSEYVIVNESHQNNTNNIRVVDIHGNGIYDALISVNGDKKYLHTDIDGVVNLGNSYLKEINNLEIFYLGITKGFYNVKNSNSNSFKITIIPKSSELIHFDSTAILKKNGKIIFEKNDYIKQ